MESFRFNRISKYFPKERDSSVLRYLFSFDRRLMFCDCHYQQFMELSGPGVLAKAIFEGGEYGRRKISMEATADAYLLNLHALVDSLPYLIFLIFQNRSAMPSKDKKASWGDSFLSGYQQRAWFGKLDAIRKCDAFTHLRAYANVSKHRYLPYLKNNLSTLRIASFSWGKVDFPEVELKDFMESTHSSLIPLILGLMNAFADALDCDAVRTPNQRIEGRGGEP